VVISPGFKIRLVERPAGEHGNHLSPQVQKMFVPVRCPVGQRISAHTLIAATIDSIAESEKHRVFLRYLKRSIGTDGPSQVWVHDSQIDRPIQSDGMNGAHVLAQ